jgi:hypothetical protein
VKARISDQLKALGAWLADQTSGSGAVVRCLPNMRLMWQAIYDTPMQGSPQILCCFTGATARGSFAQRNTLDREDREFSVVVLRGSGFKRTAIERTKVPAAGVESQVDFLDDCEDVRDLCRRLIGISGERIDYVSMKPLPGVAQPNMANSFLDGYVITFTTANDITEIRTQPPGED